MHAHAAHAQVGGAIKEAGGLGLKQFACSKSAQNLEFADRA